jgi:hypothetical protein
MLEQKKNEGKGASSGAGTPRFKVNVVTGTPLPKRSVRRGVDKQELLWLRSLSAADAVADRVYKRAFVAAPGSSAAGVVP